MSAAAQAALPPSSVLRAAMLLLYGDPKVCGKTTATLRAFPRACYIGVRSAIELIAQNTCGFTPAWIVETVTTLPELVGFLRWFVSAEGLAVRKRFGTSEVVVDDISQMCSKSMLLWRVEGGKDRYYAFNQLDQHLDWVSSLLRETGLLCALSAHKTSPVWSKDQVPQLITPGAPEVPSRNQLQSVPGWADFVAPMEPSTESLDPWWPRVIRVEQSATPVWVAGDRNGVCWESTPANLREILLASKASYDLPRLPGLEFLDDVAAAVCEALHRGEQVLPLMERIFAHYRDYAIPDTPGERHVQWGCQDGIARYVIQKRKQAGVLGALRASAARAAALAPPPAASTSTPPSAAGEGSTPASK